MFRGRSSSISPRNDRRKPSERISPAPRNENKSPSGKHRTYTDSRKKIEDLELLLMIGVSSLMVNLGHPLIRINKVKNIEVLEINMTIRKLNTLIHLEIHHMKKILVLVLM